MRFIEQQIQVSAVDEKPAEDPLEFQAIHCGIVNKIHQHYHNPFLQFR